MVSFYHTNLHKLISLERQIRLSENVFLYFYVTARFSLLQCFFFFYLSTPFLVILYWLGAKVEHLNTRFSRQLSFGISSTDIVCTVRIVVKRPYSLTVCIVALFRPSVWPTVSRLFSCESVLGRELKDDIVCEFELILPWDWNPKGLHAWLIDWVVRFLISKRKNAGMLNGFSVFTG